MSFGDNENQSAAGVAVNTPGTVAMVGEFDGTVNFGGLDHTAPGTIWGSAFVAAFGP